MELWNRIKNWLGRRKNMGSAHTLLLLAFRGVYRGSSILAKMKNATVAATVYHIWNIRNRKLFDNVDADLDSVVRKIQIVIHTLHRC